MRVGFTVVQQGDQARFERIPPQDRGRPELVSFAQTGVSCRRPHGPALLPLEQLSELRTAPARGFAQQVRRQRGGAGPLALPGIRPQSAGAAGRRFRLGPRDAGASRLFGMRDPMGGYPLYWTGWRRYLCLQHGSGAALGRPGGANPQPGVPRGLPHDVRPARRRCDRALFYEGIHRVLPGTLVLWDARTRAVRKRVTGTGWSGSTTRGPIGWKRSRDSIWRPSARRSGSGCGGGPQPSSQAAWTRLRSRCSRRGADRCGGRGRSPAHPVARL